MEPIHEINEFISKLQKELNENLTFSTEVCAEITEEGLKGGVFYNLSDDNKSCIDFIVVGTGKISDGIIDK